MTLTPQQGIALSHELIRLGTTLRLNPTIDISEILAPQRRPTLQEQLALRNLDLTQAAPAVLKPLLAPQRRPSLQELKPLLFALLFDLPGQIVANLEQTNTTTFAREITITIRQFLD